jgi:hypothetical protein
LQLVSWVCSYFQHLIKHYYLELIIYEAIAGIGASIGIPIFTVAAQNAVTKRDLGVVTSSTMYFRFIGSVIGLAVLGVIVNMTLKLNLQYNQSH